MYLGHLPKDIMDIFYQQTLIIVSYTKT